MRQMMNQKKEEQGAPSPPLAFDPVEAALRQIFDDVENEEIPSDFAALVARLDNAPRKPGIR